MRGLLSSIYEARVHSEYWKGTFNEFDTLTVIEHIENLKGRKIEMKILNYDLTLSILELSEVLK